MSSRILVVDDDREIRRLLQDYLRENEYRVTAVADGKGMWEALDSARIDLIVLDLMLPHIDGIEVCRRLRTARPALPILMLTAKGQSRDRDLAERSGATMFMSKPFANAEILAAVKAMGIDIEPVEDPAQAT